MINESLFSSNSNEWVTPQKFFDELNAEFHFNLDPCSTHQNAKCPKHFTLDEDGLSQNWGGGTKCFAILHTERKSPLGFANATRKAESQTPS